jgi:UDP-3-O-[3-hydroxymyristoyl] N-acetylglucosamine deacetylase
MFERFEKSGIGLHTGEMGRVVVEPGLPGSGVVFSSGGIEIPVRPATLSREATLATTLSLDGRSVRTVEHLLAAAAAVDVSDVSITLDGPELPILDGSAMPWFRAFLVAGARPGVRFVPVPYDITVYSNDAWARVRPLRTAEAPSIHITVPLDGFGDGELEFHPESDAFESIAAARTFALESELPRIFEAGLAKGGSLDNAVVLGPDGPLNPEGLRYPDEPVRHKMIDALGDLSVLGGLPLGRTELFRPGHHLSHALVRALKVSMSAAGIDPVPAPSRTAAS